MKIFAAAAFAAAIAVAPASASVITLGGPNANVPSITGSVDGVDYSFEALRFTLAPTALTSFSQFSTTSSSGAAMKISVTAPGIGVDGGGSAPQVDTNQVRNREAILFSTSKLIDINALKLSYIDANDTLLVFGVQDDGSLVSLTGAGTILSGLGGTVGVNNSGANGGTSVLSFADALGSYNRYIFTTRVGGEVNYGGMTGQGYRIDSIGFDTAAVPEPATWAMLIAGFGFVGAAARRRRAGMVTN
ncbi:PEPxxWA-CTERM sorting domain-containing protein [Sandaracinobacter neustonicus]|uniref:PEPxxWA-CTERM sorting domain-containing protein n=1 Tax=Sandaracinobacter neustonicus TaxID=1715348 RepID=UPI001F43DDCD|nr:PEPxxWA-CTERM sorting domain-containing protein [Sandaracinobacter neustonicus]